MITTDLGLGGGHGSSFNRNSLGFFTIIIIIMCFNYVLKNKIKISEQSPYEMPMYCNSRPASFYLGFSPFSINQSNRFGIGLRWYFYFIFHKFIIKIPHYLLCPSNIFYQKTREILKVSYKHVWLYIKKNSFIF